MIISVICLLKTIKKLWCVKENENAINFYKKNGGVIAKEKKFTLASKEYNEVAFIYNLNKE